MSSEVYQIFGKGGPAISPFLYPQHPLRHDKVIAAVYIANSICNVTLGQISVRTGITHYSAEKRAGGCGQDFGRIQPESHENQQNPQGQVCGSVCNTQEIATDAIAKWE